jgi:mono/diheme cytochrome c family protein
MHSKRAAALCAAAAAAATLAGCAPSHDQQVARGQYLVKVIACGDCHTPGGLTPKPDLRRLLAGSDADFIVPGLGVVTPPNLTPDKGTGLGTWTTDQIVTAFTTGVTPSGRTLSPAMPWQDFASLTKADATDIALYLESLPPVSHAAPGPRPPMTCVDKAEMCIVGREALPH